MKEAIKEWMRPLCLINLLVIINLSFILSIEIPGPMWGLIMIVFGFYFGERGAQNVVKGLKG